MLATKAAAGFYVIACIDLHAIACDKRRMATLIQKIDAFLADTGLSEHRAGIILAKNGRLIPRLRDGRRVWPETEAAIVDAIERERAKRDVVKGSGQAMSSKQPDSQKSVAS